MEKRYFDSRGGGSMVAENRMTHFQAARKKRLKLSAVIILVFIPLILLGSVFFMTEKWFMPASIIILIAVSAPFFMIFEQRRPRAREIVLIATMSALTVIAHSLCHIIFPIYIGTAMVIISGASLGAEAGFLIGALSRLVCNFYMGQGIWTPWQMFCWGILGFLAGLIFSKDNKSSDNPGIKTILFPIICIIAAELTAYISFILISSDGQDFVGWRLYFFGAIGITGAAVFQHKKLPAGRISISLFTFFATFIIYGGIMNFAAMATSSAAPGFEGLSLKSLKALYISGVPYDLVHAGTASIAAFFIGPSIIEKLERIKIKYGIYK